MVEYGWGGVVEYQCSMPEAKQFVDVVIRERDFVI